MKASILQPYSIMKTSMMYRNHYGKSMPEPKHQSSFRDNKDKLYASKTDYVHTVGQSIPSIPAYPMHVMIKEILILLVSLCVLGIIVFTMFPHLF